MATALATLCKSIGVSWADEKVDRKATNPEEDTGATNPEEDATPSDDRAEAEIATTVDVIIGAESDIGLLRTLILL